MREILDESDITDKTYSEITNDGYKVDVSISEIAKDRSENLNVKLFEIDLKLSWLKGNKEKFINLKTMKLVGKKI
jgi:hypothetical protein